MVSTTEREKRKMRSTPEHSERIAAAIQVDRLFTAYEIEMTPAAAFAFAAVVPAAGAKGLPGLIQRLNATIPAADFGPGHPQTGQPHHSFRIGRERGQRIMKIEIFKGFFQVDYDFMALLEFVHAIGAAAGAQVVIDAGNNSYSIEMRWGWGNR